MNTCDLCGISGGVLVDYGDALKHPGCAFTSARQEREISDRLTREAFAEEVATQAAIERDRLIQRFIKNRIDGLEAMANRLRGNKPSPYAYDEIGPIYRAASEMKDLLADIQKGCHLDPWEEG